MKKIILSLGVCISLFSCSDGFEEAQKETVQENSTSYAQRQGNKHLVTLEEAQLIATKKFPILDGPCNNRLDFPIFTDIEIGDVITILDKQKNPAMYLFNKSDGKGFLLMSASKLEEPILAYSNSSTIDMQDLPSALRIWLHLGVTKISQLSKLRTYYNNSVYDAWAAYGIAEQVKEIGLEDGNGNIIQTPDIQIIPIGMPCVNQQTKIDKLLGNISWGQAKGYNKYQNNAPSMSRFYDEKYDYKYPAGCVMVAFGQVMKSHGDFGNIISNGQVVDKVMNYNQDYYGVSTVLRNLYDIALQTSQTEKGTGGYISEYAGVIKTSNFSYTSANYTKNFDYSIILNDLEQGLPVVLSGYRVAPDNENQLNSILSLTYMQNNKMLYSDGLSTVSGHAWVCDGYLEEVQKVKIMINGSQYGEHYETTREFWHMNWGWHHINKPDGKSNGWYRDGLFQPNYEYNSGTDLIDFDDIVAYDYVFNGNSQTGTYHQGYYYKRSMVYNIQP